MKTALLLGALALTSAAFAKPEKFDEIYQELEIMKGVVDTSLKQAVGKNELGYRSIDVSYLVSQGAIFTIETRSAGWALSSMVNSAMDINLDGDSFVVFSGDDDSFSFEFDFEDDRDWQEAIREATRAISRASKEYSRELRRLKEQEQEVNWEVREYERELRQLEFEAKNAAKETANRLKEKIKQQEKEILAYKSKGSELSELAAKVEKEYKATVEKQKQAKQEIFKQFLAKFETSIGESMCRFGGGLRQLPKDENISFVLKDFEQGDSKGRRSDRIYVFPKSDIDACNRDKIDVNELLTKARVYTF